MLIFLIELIVYDSAQPPIGIRSVMYKRERKAKERSVLTPSALSTILTFLKKNSTESGHYRRIDGMSVLEILEMFHVLLRCVDKRRWNTIIREAK
jgi:hypothetical protein